MSETVYILGAGISVALGAPLMNNFLGFIRNVSNLKEMKDHKQDFAAVMTGYQKLRGANSILSMNYETNIEELFSSFEMIRLLGLDLLENLSGEELIETVRRVIGLVIENSITYHAISTNKSIKYYPAEYIFKFLQAIRDYHKKYYPDSNIAIMTFNYDLIIDHCLYYMKAPFSYCLDGDENKKISLLKLHGSLNWGKCKKCNKIIPYELEDYFNKNPLSSERG